jgi:hypothetical protein
MYYWLVGAVNPLLFIAVIQRTGKVWPVILIFLSFGYVRYFGKELANKNNNNSNLSSYERSLSIFGGFGPSASSVRSPDLSHAKEEERPFASNLESSFRNCLRLRGLSGQVEDKTLLFYNYRSLTFWLLAPLFWLVELLYKLRNRRFFCEILAYITTIFILPFELTGMGVVRSLYWCGPFYWLRFYLGIYGSKSLVFNCVLFSLFFPEVFTSESGMVMLTILFAMNSILKEVSSFFSFVAGNILVNALIGLASYRLELMDLLLSPLVEVLAYIYNLGRYFNLGPVDFFQNLGVFELVCLEPKVRVSISFPEHGTEMIFSIFLSYFLLDYLNRNLLPNSSTIPHIP